MSLEGIEIYCLCGNSDCGCEFDLRFIDRGKYVAIATNDGEYTCVSPQDVKRIAEFCMSFWIRHASTMQFDSMKEIE